MAETYEGRKVRLNSKISSIKIIRTDSEGFYPSKYGTVTRRRRKYSVYEEKNIHNPREIGVHA